MDKPRFFITEVFHHQPYSGHQLATFVLCDSLDTEHMQQIAQTLNFPATSFITSLQPSQGGYNVRIFTAQAEIAFDNSACLGTAHILRNHLIKQPANRLKLNLPSSQTSLTFDLNGDRQLLWLQQPTTPLKPVVDLGPLLSQLALKPQDLALDWPVVQSDSTENYYLLAVNSLAALQAARQPADSRHQFLLFCPEDLQQQPAKVRRLGAETTALNAEALGLLTAYLQQYFPNLLPLQLQTYDDDPRRAQFWLTADARGIQIGGQVRDIAAGVWG